MIKFIDTNLFEDDSIIHVIVYSDYIDRSKRKINSLISGETIIEAYESKTDYRVVVSKDNIRILLKTMPLSTSSRGHRSQYAIVDRIIIGHKHGIEIFENTINSKTMMYHHLLKDKDIKFGEIVNIMLF